jgi:hypothetical protein
MTLTNMTETRPLIPKGKPVILVEDTIHTGDQLSRVLIDLKELKIRVNKVICYLEDENGVKSLVERRLLKSGQVLSLFSSHSEEEYLKQSKQLQVFFRSHIEPTDPDVNFNLYNANVKRPEQLVEILTPVLGQFFGQTVIEELDEIGLASTTKEFKCKTADHSILQKWANRLFKKRLAYSVAGLNLRFKINVRGVDCDFTVIPKIFADSNINGEAGIGGCLRRSDKCFLSNFSYPSDKTEEVKNSYCPACLDLVLSSFTLDKLNKAILRAFKKAKVECTLKQRNRTVKWT